MMTTTRAARSIMVIVSSGEQTEAYVFHAMEMRGYSASETDEAIGELLDAGLIRSTVIDGRRSGFGYLPALVHI